MHPKTHPLALALSGALALSLFAPPAAALGADHGAHPAPASTGTSATTPVRYMILLREPALASYHGSTGRFATPPRIASGARMGRLDVHSVEALGYVQHLAEQQATVVADIERQLGHTLPTIARLQHALNGIVVDLTPAEAARVATRSDVARVEADKILPLNAEPDPSFIGADTIWDGSASAGVATQGEGVVVGVIDTGINWNSPSFAAIDPINGYQHLNPLGAGHYLGSCAAAAPNPDLGHCNDKLIGMYNFVNTANSAEDSDGHGSHTSSTAGGNHRMADIGGGRFAIAGVAPRANIVMFSCFSGGGCGSLAAALSANQAVADGVVDALNFSVAGGTDPWSDMVSQAFLGATEAGIFIAAAGGNDGPIAQSINHIEPWVTTVAASTLDYATGFGFSLGLPGGAPANTQHLGVRPGQAPIQASDLVGVPIVRSPTFDSPRSDACSAFAAGTFSGALAVIRLNASASACSSVQRQTNAVAAGAVGVVFVDANNYLAVAAGGAVWTMLLADWDNVWSAMQANPAAATASIELPLSLYPYSGDHIADFSSRGPNLASDLGGQYLLKPDLSAPGVDILAAYAGAADAVAFESGTSMASPHMAGAGALLRAVHPEWTPMEIKSALMTTAWTTNIVTQNGGPTTPWDRGAGRVDLGVAARAGLLLDETGANFRAADPTRGGALPGLNLPSAVMGACGAGNCRFTRRLRNPLDTSVAWNATLTGLPNANVTPSAFTLAAGASQDVSVSINPAALAGTWTFAELRLATVTAGIPDAHLPIAVKRNGGAPLLLLSTSALSATLAAEVTATRTLTLSNGGTGAVHWSIDTTASGCAKPSWISYSPTSGTQLSGGSPRTLSIALDTHGVAAGTQTSTLCIASDDAAVPLAKVDLTLTVEAAEVIFRNGFDVN